MEKHENDTSALQKALHLPPTDPDLTRLAEAWPTLPAALKTGILAMIEAAKNNG